MLRLEMVDFQLNDKQTGKFPIIEQQINIEIRIANLYAVFLANERKVLAKLQNKIA